MSRKKVLVYAEPHPIRNSFTEFLDVAKFMSQALATIAGDELDWRVFSNKYVLDELEKIAICQDKTLYPTPEEQQHIDSKLEEWTTEQIALRQELISGNGILSEFYVGILERISSVFEFDAILLWSENGAVRNYASHLKIPVLHMELGPTRAPFPETCYIDCSGTNGSVSLNNFDISAYPEGNVVCSETWISLEELRKKNTVSVFEHGLSAKKRTRWITDRNYVVVALQLADDVNTISHSPFSTPRQFLETILPPLLGHGLKVYVKGHPGAVARPINLTYEIDALRYAKSLGDDVEVLDRNMPADEFIALMTGSRAVCSINSSVSFEALLIGVPGLLFGDAAYDIGRYLLKAGDDFLRNGAVSIDRAHIDRVTTVLFRHYLHPRRPDAVGEILWHLLASYRVETGAEGFLSVLLSNTNYGADILNQEIERSERTKELERLLPSEKKIDSSFIGHVDTIISGDHGSSVEIEVKGWIGRRGGNTPVELVAVRLGQEISGPNELRNRPDVLAVHPEIPEKCGFSLRARLQKPVPSEQAELIFFTAEEVFSCNAKSGKIHHISPVDTARHMPPVDTATIGFKFKDMLGILKR